MSNSNKLQGRIIEIYDTQQITEKFKKKEFVIETEGTYPDQIIFQTTNDRVSILNNLEKGDEVEITYDVHGRGYQKEGQEKRYYNQLTAFKVDLLTKGKERLEPKIEVYNQPEIAYHEIPTTTEKIKMPEIETQENDLPF